MQLTAGQQAARDRITAALAAAGLALPGTLTVRSYECGKPRCRCHNDPASRHGRVPHSFRTADPYRIFTGKDGNTWQVNTGNSLLSSARKQHGWSWRLLVLLPRSRGNLVSARRRWETG